MSTWKEIRFRCITCDGSGACPGSAPGSCLACLGTGYTNDSRLEVEVDERVDSAVEKLDAIITEQAALRADLTNVLTDIWNKVKNL